MRNAANIKISALIFLLACTIVCSAQNVSYTVLYNFTNLPDGQNPDGSIVEGSDGALYGTTDYGGTNIAAGFGTVFKINKDGSGYSNFVQFSENVAKYNVFGGLMRASNGVIYGVTEGGNQNYGTIFNMNGDGSDFSIIYDFETVNHDVGFPEGHFIQGVDGGLYGVSAASGSTGYGTIFRFDPDSGGHSVLYNFTNSALLGNGFEDPSVGLIQGRDGMLYGTTYSDAMPDGSGGWVFTINTNGIGFKILYVLTNSPTSFANPEANLIQGSDGALYGTTAGENEESGSIFRINTDGTGYNVLLQFGSSGSGSDPEELSLAVGLMEGSDGALYGEAGLYTIFRINKDGSNFSVLHDFSVSGGNGIGFGSSLIQGSDGALYGTTYGGGAYSFGTVFRLVVAPQIGCAFTTNGTPTISLTGLAGQNCQIQASTNLTAWVTLTNLVINTNGLNQFTDFSATNFNQRYYRAITQ